MTSTDDPNLLCRNGGVDCFCKIGYFSPSGDAETNKDCTERTSTASIGVEFTMDPANFKWEGGAARFNAAMAPLENWIKVAGNIDGVLISQTREFAKKLSHVRSSTSITATADPTLVQSKIDGTHVWLTGLIYTYTWYARDIADSPNSVAEDLIKQARADLLASDLVNYLVTMGDEHLVITDKTSYPTWGSWGEFDTCDEDSCTHTRKKKCDQNGSQIPCIEDPDQPSTETQTCTSNKCRKYAGQFMMRYETYAAKAIAYALSYF